MEWSDSFFNHKFLIVSFCHPRLVIDAIVLASITSIVAAAATIAFGLLWLLSYYSFTDSSSICRPIWTRSHFTAKLSIALVSLFWHGMNGPCMMKKALRYRVWNYVFITWFVPRMNILATVHSMRQFDAIHNQRNARSSRWFAHELFFDRFSLSMALLDGPLCTVEEVVAVDAFIDDALWWSWFI